jgi:hypothetical protein
MSQYLNAQNGETASTWTSQADGVTLGPLLCAHKSGLLLLLSRLCECCSVCLVLFQLSYLFCST